MKTILEYLLSKSSIKTNDKTLFEEVTLLFSNDEGKVCSQSVEQRLKLIKDRIDEENTIKFLEIIIRLNEEKFMVAESLHKSGTYLYFYDKNNETILINKHSKFYFLSSVSEVPLLKVFNMPTNTYYEIFCGIKDLLIKSYTGNENVFIDYFDRKLTLGNKLFSSTKDPLSEINKIIEEIAK